MIRLKPYLYCLLIALLTFGGCANKGPVRGNINRSPRIIFQFSVQGRLQLNRTDVTYYILLNAPDDKPGATLDPATEGPRVNGPSLNDTPINLNGRLPFTGLLPGDIESKWTDFYFLQGSTDGRGVVGRGIRRPDGSPELALRNYPVAFWRAVSDNTIEIQMLFSDLFANYVYDQAETTPKIPANVIVNLASSDSIDTGQGYVFDWWKSNIPFAISTTPNNTEITDQDPNQQLIMRPVTTKPLPQLPVGVNAADLNIVSYNYRVIVL